jgi:hypothetical protein
MWKRLVSRKMFWDFAVLGKVIRERGRFMILTPWEVTDGWLSFA